MHIHIYALFCVYDRVEVVYPRVAELNPYVQVGVSTCPLDDSTDLSFLRGYQVCEWPYFERATQNMNCVALQCVQYLMCVVAVCSVDRCSVESAKEGE